MPALERRDISREQGRARERARGTADSEGRCLVQSLREIDKESTTASAQLGHRLRMLARRVHARMHAEISPSKLGLSPPRQPAAQTPLRRAFKRAHFAHPFCLPSRDSRNRFTLFYPDTADFPFRAFPFPRHALRFSCAAFIVTHFILRVILISHGISLSLSLLLTSLSSPFSTT